MGGGRISFGGVVGFVVVITTTRRAGDVLLVEINVTPTAAETNPPTRVLRRPATTHPDRAAGAVT